MLLSYFGARFYNAETGIFIESDPVHEFFNPYAYGPQNPINGSDPEGSHWEVDKDGVVKLYIKK